MSSLPGLTLEAYAMWDFDLIVDGDTSANPSLEIAEAMGVETRRRSMPKEDFQRIVIARLEDRREQIEYLLSEFDEQECGWRQYASGQYWMESSISEVILNDLKEYFDGRKAAEPVAVVPEVGQPIMGEQQGTGPGDRWGFLDAGVPTDNPVSEYME